MGFSKVILVLSIALAFLVSSSVSHKIWSQKTPHDQQVDNVHQTSPTLPRKLKHDHEEANVKSVGNEHFMPFKVKEEALPGKLQNKEGVEVEVNKEADPSQFFTMDYPCVKRRRPIHNTDVHC
ncbi:OLC1v1032550C1 [Oldenlandia corymbosa var. corymbosa]|uniref:OLC1v1032550C1 n=1 Tax=Oldenlandia corymbosa var. corymbosa TaxID=529605 RepID=A0AAV1CM02_OLDCO|nr:OLC1v1032550C1 [Oldenlandia corymbosa var. corymbosa]